MGRSCPSAIITVEVFEEQNVIMKMFVILKFLVFTEHRPLPLLVFCKDTDHAIRKIICNLFQCVHFSGTCGMFDLKVIPIIMMEALQRFYDEVVYGKPYWTTPVGVATKQCGLRFARRVLY